MLLSTPTAAAIQTRPLESLSVLEVEAMTTSFGQMALATALRDSDIDGIVLSEISEEELLSVVQLKDTTAILAVLKNRVKGYYRKVQEWKAAGVSTALFSDIVHPHAPPAPSQDGNRLFV